MLQYKATIIVKKVQKEWLCAKSLCTFVVRDVCLLCVCSSFPHPWQTMINLFFFFNCLLKKRQLHQQHRMHTLWLREFGLVYPRKKKKRVSSCMHLRLLNDLNTTFRVAYYSFRVSVKAYKSNAIKKTTPLPMLNCSFPLFHKQILCKVSNKFVLAHFPWVLTTVSLATINDACANETYLWLIETRWFATL